MDGAAASALATENAALRAKNDADTRKLQQLEVILANVARDIDRLSPTFDRRQHCHQRDVKLHRQQLEAKNVKLTQQNHDLLAATAARSDKMAKASMPQGHTDEQNMSATATSFDDEQALSHPAAVEMLDALLEKENTVAALRKDVAQLQSSLAELDDQRLDVSTSALRREVELVEAQEALRRAEIEQVGHRMASLQASCARLVERAGVLRREKLNMTYAGNGLLETAFAQLKKERDALKDVIKDLFRHSQQMSLLAADQSRLQSNQKELVSRLIRRHQLLRSHTNGLRSLLSAYILKRAGLRDVSFNMEERIKAIKRQVDELQATNDRIRATNTAATTLLGLLDMQQREHNSGTELVPIPPELTTKSGRDVSQLLGSVRTVEAAIVEAGGERAWEHMAEVLWRVRQQIGEKLTLPAQLLRTEIALVENEIADTKALHAHQETLGEILVNKRAAATVEVTDLFQRSLELAATMSELETLDCRCQQLGEMRRALEANPSSWRKIWDSLRQDRCRRSHAVH